MCSQISPEVLEIEDIWHTGHGTFWLTVTYSIASKEQRLLIIFCIPTEFVLNRELWISNRNRWKKIMKIGENESMKTELRDSGQFTHHPTYEKKLFKWRIYDFDNIKFLLTSTPVLILHMVYPISNYRPCLLWQVRSVIGVSDFTVLDSNLHHTSVRFDVDMILANLKLKTQLYRVRVRVRILSSYEKWIHCIRVVVSFFEIWNFGFLKPQYCETL